MIVIQVDSPDEERALRALLNSDVASAFRGRYDYRIEVIPVSDTSDS